MTINRKNIRRRRNRQRLRCNRALRPQPEDVPIPNKPAVANRSESQQLKPVNRRPKEITRFAHDNTFSALLSKAAKTTDLTWPPPRIAKTSLRRQTNFKASTTKYARKRGVKKGVPYCRTRPRQSSQVRQYQEVPPPSNVWTDTLAVSRKADRDDEQEIILCSSRNASQGH